MSRQDKREFQQRGNKDGVKRCKRRQGQSYRTCGASESLLVGVPDGSIHSSKPPLLASRPWAALSRKAAWPNDHAAHARSADLVAQPAAPALRLTAQARGGLPGLRQLLEPTEEGLGPTRRNLDDEVHAGLLSACGVSCGPDGTRAPARSRRRVKTRSGAAGDFGGPARGPWSPWARSFDAARRAGRVASQGCSATSSARGRLFSSSGMSAGDTGDEVGGASDIRAHDSETLLSESNQLPGLQCSLIDFCGSCYTSETPLSESR